MARTKQTARKSGSGATLFYSSRKAKIPRRSKRKITMNKLATAKPVESAKPKQASSSLSTRNQIGGDRTLAHSWHRKHAQLSTTTESLTSLSDALSKLGTTSASSGTSIMSTNLFSNSMRLLGMVKDVCEAFSGVPYVKSVAGLVQQIIEIADQVQAYKDKCQALVDKVTLFSLGVFEGLLSLSRTANPGVHVQSLESDLLAFFRVLEGILATLNRLTSERASSRFFRYVARAELLEAVAEQSRNLETYIQYFNTRSSIAIRLGLGNVRTEDSNRPLLARHKIKRSIPPSPKLYGRDIEVTRIENLLMDPSNKQVHLAILGPGGMGKTSLALSILSNDRIVSTFQSGRFFLTCDTAPSLDLFINEMATALDINVDGLPSQVLQSIFTQLRQRRCLIVLDNFETLWDPLPTRSEVEGFLSELSVIPTVNLLLTLRGSQHPAGVEWFQLLPPLKPLQLQHAEMLFQSIARKMDNSYSVELIQAVDRIPLAVTLVAHLAAVHDISIESLWERWIEEKTMMVERGSDRLANLDTSIRLSLTSPRMNHDPNALSLLSIIALLPNGMSIQLFRSCEIHLLEVLNVKRAMTTLKQNALLYEDDDKTLRMLNPIRQYVLSHHPPSDIAFEYIQEYFIQLALLGSERDPSIYGQFRQEIGNIEAVLVKRLKSNWPIADTARAILSLAEFTYISGVGSCIPLERVVEYLSRRKPKPHKPVRKSVRRLILGRLSKHKNDAEGTDAAENNLITLQADCLGCWGQLLSRQGHYQLAKDKFELALELHIQQGDTVGQAADLHNIGCLLTLDEAAEKFTSALTLHEKSGDKAGTAYDMIGLGQVYLQRRQLVQAQQVFTSALRIFDGLEGEEEDVLGRITALNNLGHTFTAWNKFEEADAFFDKAIQANELIKDVVCRADSLCGQASTLLLRSRWSEAEKKIREAMEFREPFKDPDLYHVLGRVKIAQWKLTEAVEILQYTRTLPRDPKDDFGRGDDLKYLAYAYALLGRVDESEAMLEDVKILYNSAENTVGLAEVGIAKAEIWCVQDNLDDAETSAKEAVEVMGRMDCKIGRAHTLYVLGGVELAKGKFHDARECVQLAFELHHEIGSLQGQADDLGRLAEIVIMEALGGGGRKEDLHEAEGNLNKATSLHDGIGDTAGLGDDWYLRALLTMHVDPGKAEEAARTALKLHGDAEVTYKQAKDLLLIARLLKGQGKKQESKGAADSAKKIFKGIRANGRLGF